MKSTPTTRWDLNELEVSASAEVAALNVVRRLTAEKRKASERWATAVRLAQRNGASLREIAEAADVAPQTVANLVKSR